MSSTMSIEDKLNYIKELKEEIETNKRVEAFFRTKGIIKSYEVFNPQTRKYEEDCIKVPEYDKHKLDKKCYNCAVGHMKQKTPNGLYYQLTELTNGKFICDGDECFYVMMEDIRRKITDV